MTRDARGRAFAALLLTGTLLVVSPTTVRANGAADAAVAPAQIEARTVSTFKAQRELASWTLAFSGMLVARDEIAVGAPFQEQRIASVEVEVGDRVAAGQLLVRLDTAHLENRLRETEGRVARSSAALKQQEIALEQAEDKLKRSIRLQAMGTISEQAHSERVSAVTTAEQAVAQNQAELTEAQAQAAEVRRQIERADVRAPAAGTVSERLARAGALAGADPLIRMIRDGEVEFSAEIPEGDLGNLRAGQPVTVALSGGHLEVRGEVRVVAPKIDSQTRLGMARIALKTTASLFPGMFGRAEVMVDRREAIVIDDAAVVYGPSAGESAVFVVADGRVQRKAVTTGNRRNGKVEIRDGLLAGEVVVAKSGPWLRDGETVNPVDLPGAEKAAR